MTDLTTIIKTFNFLIDSLELTSDENILQFWRDETKVYGSIDYLSYIFFKSLNVSRANIFLSEYIGSIRNRLVVKDFPPNTKYILRKPFDPSLSSLLTKYTIYDPRCFEWCYNPKYLENIFIDRNVWNKKTKTFAFGFNLLYREEIFLRHSITPQHRCCLNVDEMKSIITKAQTLTPVQRIMDTFPLPTFEQSHLFVSKKHEDIVYDFDAASCITRILKYFDTIIGLFPKDSGIILSIHGSSVLHSICSMTKYTDLDIRICHSDHTMLSEEEFVNYASKLIVTFKSYLGSFIYTQHSSTKYTFKFPRYSLDFYNAPWGAFNNYHVAMVRADLQFYPVPRLVGTFSFMYSLLSGISVDIRYSPTSTTSLIEVLKKYSDKGFAIYCNSDNYNEIYNEDIKPYFCTQHYGQYNFVCGLHVSFVPLYVPTEYNIDKIKKKLSKPHIFVVLSPSICVIYTKKTKHIVLKDCRIRKNSFDIYKDGVCIYKHFYKVLQKTPIRNIKYLFFQREMTTGYRTTTEYESLFDHLSFLEVLKSLGGLSKSSSGSDLSRSSSAEIQLKKSSSGILKKASRSTDNIHRVKFSE